MTNTQPTSFDIESELTHMGFTPEVGANSISTTVLTPAAHTPEEFDFMNYIDREIQSLSENIESPLASAKPSSSFFSETIKERIKFGIHYISATSVVFGILLIATNWSAYSAIAHNYLNPVELQDASYQMESALSQSKITVYANEESNALHSTEISLKAEEIKNQLHAEDQTIEEDPFNIQSLIPTNPTVSASFEITPYENRIIIPKIGKNIPLVDIAGESNFDFDHMENIFMQELEKGVVRYPGTALPGQVGNSFIFGHSSNYPWVKGDYNDIFALIDHLEFGDKIIVYYNQKKFIYTIREKKIIKPGDVKALERDSNKTELSLMTCWPIGTTLKRMLVFAELTNE